MTNTPTEKAKRIIEHYGTQHQLVKLCEECAELTQQAAKCYDAGMEYSYHLVEEMADVKVMLMARGGNSPNVFTRTSSGVAVPAASRRCQGRSCVKGATKTPAERLPTAGRRSWKRVTDGSGKNENIRPSAVPQERRAA